MKLSSLFFGACLLLTNRSFAATHYVDINSPNPTPPYTDWAAAATNIQDAIDAATTGELVIVNNGIYKTGGRVVYGAMTNRVVVDKPVTVQSVNGPAVTVIQGNQVPTGTNGPSAIRCVYLAEGAILAGFTLTNGATRTSGDFTNEVSGGGVYCEGFGAVVSNCVLTVNAAARHGGGAIGGTLIGCTLVRNQAELDGGGAYASSINNSLIISNHAAAGGGACYGTLNNCLVLTNSAGEGGGGFRADMHNCTVVGNSANTAGGVYLAPYATITNCIVYYNTGGGFPNYAPGYTSNSLSYCCTTPMPTVPSSGVGNTTNAPLFVNLAGGDFHLQSQSPCINAGLNIAAAGNKDFDGGPRITGGTVDTGAYEFQSPSSLLSYAWLQQYGLATDGTADYADGDGDGWSNWNEWRAGTDPKDATSLLRILSTSANGSGIKVSWQSVTSRSYFLERAGSLSLPVMFQPVQGNLAGQAGTTFYTDTNAIGAGPFFYRVGVLSGQ